MFEIDDDEGYTGVDVEVWQAMQFINKLEDVTLDELSPGDRECPLCRQAYDDLEKENIACIPVRLLCSHIFGKECLAVWITPIGGWKENNSRWEEEKDWFEHPFIRFSGSADCPVCRQEFFEKPRNWESAKGLEARLMLWDRAYEKVGCRRSEKEEQSRADLVQYIEFYREANGDTIGKTEAEIDQRWSELEAYHAIARGYLFEFIRCQKKKCVSTPVQVQMQRYLGLISILELGIKLDDPLFDDSKENYSDYDSIEIDFDSGNDGEEEIDRQEVGSEMEDREAELNVMDLNDRAIPDNDDHMEEAE